MLSPKSRFYFQNMASLYVSPSLWELCLPKSPCSHLGEDSFKDLQMVLAPNVLFSIFSVILNINQLQALSFLTPFSVILWIMIQFKLCQRDHLPVLLLTALSLCAPAIEIISVFFHFPKPRELIINAGSLIPSTISTFLCWNVTSLETLLYTQV